MCFSYFKCNLCHTFVINYRLQCPSAGLFQCSITGLVFRMEGEGEVLYRTVPWDRRLLAQNGKRPAGPLFKFTCLNGSVCQLHLPHCEIFPGGGCDYLSVAHVTDDIIEFIPPHDITETHIIINISGFCAYGLTKDKDAPVFPIKAQVLLFYQPSDDPELESVLHVLLLPRNVVLMKVQEERARRNGTRETFIETTSDCKLTPDQTYSLSTDGYHRVIPEFQLFPLQPLLPTALPPLVQPSSKITGWL
uniref:FIIND domain-containing protein n=1 Tax=Hucho hucho TaxID=62062 RepID=A0A4W5LE35_9TELE